MNKLSDAFKRMMKEDRANFILHSIITVLFLLIFIGFLLPYAVEARSVSGLKSLLGIKFIVYVCLILGLIYPVIVLLGKEKLIKLDFMFILIVNTLLLVWLLFVYIVGLSDTTIRLGFGFFFLLIVIGLLWFIKLRRENVLKLIQKLVVKKESEESAEAKLDI